MGDRLEGLLLLGIGTLGAYLAFSGNLAPAVGALTGVPLVTLKATSKGKNPLGGLVTGPQKSVPWWKWPFLL